MIELIKITETNGQRAVSARELHAFLESKQEFANWIKNRIEKYDLIENVDFVRLTNLSSESQGRGGQNKVEYALSIDAAKELSMVEGNDKGKQARKYFISCERKLKEVVTTPKEIGFKEKMAAASWAAKFLNLNDNSKLLIAKTILEPLDLPLPDYTPSKGQLLPAKALLEQNGIALSSQQFNRKMMEKGYMTELSRPSSKGLIKHFKSLTSKASEYGENQVNTSNPRETQPLYYADKFISLLSELGIAN